MKRVRYCQTITKKFSQSESLNSQFSLYQVESRIGSGFKTRHVCHHEQFARSHMLNQLGLRNFANKIFGNMTFANGESPLYFRLHAPWYFANWRKYSGLSPISLSIKCGLKIFLSATLVSVSYDIPIPITLT